MIFWNNVDAGGQAIISCDGSVGVTAFMPVVSTDPVAILVLEDLSEICNGKPGDRVPDELMKPRKINDINGVLIVFRSTESIDVFIEELNALRGYFSVANSE